MASSETRHAAWQTERRFAVRLSPEGGPPTELADGLTEFLDAFDLAFDWLNREDPTRTCVATGPDAASDTEGRLHAEGRPYGAGGLVCHGAQVDPRERADRMGRSALALLPHLVRRVTLVHARPRRSAVPRTAPCLRAGS